jgi:hypothetical protein
MIYLIVGLGVLFASLSFILNQKNAKYLLSGYNTMSSAERASFPLERFLRFFKRFHLFLGASFVALGAALYYFVDEGTAGMFIGIYPILAYMYFIWQSGSYQSRQNNSKNINRWALGILGIVLVFVVALSWMGRKEDRIYWEAETLTISGMYGTKLAAAEITSMDLVPELPAIDRKKHGFGLGQQYKGRFKTAEGEEVLLVLNSMQRPFIKITRSSGIPIFYSSGSQKNEEIFQEINSLEQ